jgi:hypothetical protein
MSLKVDDRVFYAGPTRHQKHQTLDRAAGQPGVVKRREINCSFIEWADGSACWEPNSYLVKKASLVLARASNAGSWLISRDDVDERDLAGAVAGAPPGH